MARATAGTSEARTLTDGTRAFRLRFPVDGEREIVTLHERPGCQCGCGGGWDERSARTELGNILARVRAGVWEPPKASVKTPASQPNGASMSFHDYASRWLQAKIDGIIGEQPIDKNTEADYRWRLSGHLLPFFAVHQLTEIDRAICLDFKAHKLREAQELREAIKAGADIRDQRGRRRVPLSSASIRKLIDTLAAILDDAIEDGYIDRNPARGKRMRVRVPKPNRTFLEMDELACLLDAAATQEQPLHPAETPAALGTTTALVAHLLAQGKRPQQIAKELGLAESTVSHHVARLNANVGRGYVGRRVICEILGRSGVRASELCDLRIGEVRLHDPTGARFRIPDAKTETGIREVQMSPDLVEAIVEHIERLRRVDAPAGPDAYLVPNLRGRRITRQRVAEIVREAATHAGEQLTEHGLPPLPHTTPHTLRRTYISIVLLANNFDVKWVMSQVGHADSKMTMDVYAQLEQRAKRSHGTNFDRLIREARDQINERPAATPPAAQKAPKRHRAQKSEDSAPARDAPGTSKSAPEQAKREMARPRLELGTPRFSVVCSTN
jgi:integrase